MGRKFFSRAFRKASFQAVKIRLAMEFHLRKPCMHNTINNCRYFTHFRFHRKDVLMSCILSLFQLVSLLLQQKQLKEKEAEQKIAFTVQKKSHLNTTTAKNSSNQKKYYIQYAICIIYDGAVQIPYMIWHIYSERYFTGQCIKLFSYLQTGLLMVNCPGPDMLQLTRVNLRRQLTACLPYTMNCCCIQQTNQQQCNI